MSLCNHELSVMCRHCTASCIVVIVFCGQSSRLQVQSQKLHILHTYAHMPPVYAHELVREYRLYFLNGSHFSQFLFVALLTTWLNMESSYLAQLCIYTGATHTREIMELWTIFFKLLIFGKIHISHFVSPCVMYFEIHITMNSFCVACICAYFNGNCFIGVFGIYDDEPM